MQADGSCLAQRSILQTLVLPPHYTGGAEYALRTSSVGNTPTAQATRSQMPYASPRAPRSPRMGVAIVYRKNGSASVQAQPTEDAAEFAPDSGGRVKKRAR